MNDIQKSITSDTVTMKKLLLIFALFVYSKALDCGIHMNKNEALRDTINKCVRDNKTLEEIWDITSMSSDSESSGSSAEELPPVDGKMVQNFRTRRFTDQDNSQNDTDSSQTQSKEHESGNCVIQCIFENLEMTDTNGFPEREKVVEALLKDASGREFRDFLQDTTDDCFQEIEKETDMDTCNYSLKLVNCLAEKGKSNCADWPIGDLPFHS